MSKKTSFYMSRAKDAKLSDLSVERIAWFVEKASEEREYSFSRKSSPKNVVEELVLDVDGGLSNAALLLFGKKPQKFCPAAIIKCSFYTGTEVTRPISSQHDFGQTLFEQIDSAMDFVLSKLDRTVGGREESATAEVSFELPREAIREIIINAVAHRDYDSSGSIQIDVFADRIEIVNPGSLPGELSVDDLTKGNISVPVNPFLARPMYLAGYMNRLGYGTQRVINQCRKAGLPDPKFDPAENRFRVTIWRNWLTDDRLNQFNLNERQRSAIRYLKSHRTITNSKYQSAFGVAKRTASQDLNQLLSLDLVSRKGTTGKGVFYRLTNGALKGHKGHES